MTAHPNPRSFAHDDAVGLSDERQVLRFITCGSVDDGKSSLIGRLLHDTKQVFTDQIASLRQQSRRYGTRGTALDLALLVDGLQAEREQGITIDVAYRFFSTAKRSFIVADTPGHEQYTRNMATGASTADAAVILVDARHGLTRQTRRHTQLVAMLGIRHVALAINKMDLVDWSQARFDAIAQDFQAFAADRGFADVTAIPLSAITGDNVVERGDARWYEGATLLEFLEETPVGESERAAPFALPVQWVNRPNSEFRGFSGLIASGSVAVGSPLVVQPSGLRSTVTQILTPDGAQTSAVEGQSVTLVLADEVDASRGAILTAPETSIKTADTASARLFWAADLPLIAGMTFWAKVGSATVNAVVERIVGRIDPETGLAQPADDLRTNDIGDVVLSFDRLVAVTPYATNRALGSFILIRRDSADTAALGLIS